MDIVLANTLRANLKNAKTVGTKIDAIVVALISVVDCQLSTAEKVKAMVEERKDWKSKISGATAIIGFIKWVATSSVVSASVAYTVKLIKLGAIQ